MNNTGNGKDVKRSSENLIFKFSDDLGWVLGCKHRVRAYRTHPTPDAQFQSDSRIRRLFEMAAAFVYWLQTQCTCLAVSLGRIWNGDIFRKQVSNLRPSF